MQWYNRDLLKAVCFWSLCVFWVTISFSKALGEISFVLALVAWIALKINEGKLSLNQMPRYVWLPLAGYFILVLASCFWSDVPKENLRGIVKVFKQLALFWMVIDVFKTRCQIKRFEPVFLIFSLFLIFDGIWQLQFGKDLLRGFEIADSYSGLRLSASFKTYGQLASLLVTTLPFLVMLGILVIRYGRKRLMTIAYIIAIAGGFWLLYMTRTRGAYVAFILGVLLFLILKRQILTLLLICLFLEVAFILLPPQMIMHFDTNFKEQSLIERYYLWDRAIHVIKAKPLTGTGINTYTAVHQNYDKTNNWRVRGYYAHNGYLQLAAETGIPSLILLLVFFVGYLRTCFVRLHKMRDRGDRWIIMGLLVGIMNFLFFVLSDTVLHNPQPVMIFWFVMGLCWAYLEAYSISEEAC